MITAAIKDYISFEAGGKNYKLANKTLKQQASVIEHVWKINFNANMNYLFLVIVCGSIFIM